MLKKININKLNIAIVSLGAFSLFITALAISGRMAKLKKNNLKNLNALNQVLPGFNEQSLEELRRETRQLEGRLLGLVYLFDPEQQIKKDYDPAIYFVEELGKISQFLKLKAANKQINYPDLGFKEALPEEKEARYMLKQLYTLKEIVSRGMDAGVNFTSIVPLAPEDLDVFNGGKIIKTRIELSAQAPALIEFLIQAAEIVPLCTVEGLLLKSEGPSFKADMVFSQKVIEVGWKDKGIPFKPLSEKEIFLEQEKFVNILRGSNPFSTVRPQGYTEFMVSPAAEQARQLPRFLYRGKAVLKGKEVAVIEDTLSQETVFIAPHEKLGDFYLEELQDYQIVLINANNNQKIIIKREEK